MVLELIRSNKNKALKLYLIIFAITSMLLVSGCDSRSGKYPHQISEQWYCEEPQISLKYSKQENSTLEFFETLFYDGEVKEIDLAMHSSYYCVYPAESNLHDDRLFSGSWKYRNGNLVLKVEEDFIFDGEYSQIILKPLDRNSTP